MAAANHFNAAFQPIASTEQGLLVETVIASAGRMAGTMLFRSVNFPVNSYAPGVTVLSEQARDMGTKLMELMFATLGHLGHAADVTTINQDAFSTKASHFTLQKTQEQFDPIVLSYCSAKHLTFEDAAFSLAMTSAILIHDCRWLLGVQSGASIALHGFIEGLKTAPIAMATPTGQVSVVSVESKKPWYKIW